jgi:tripartite-type tricarboxylate transporter receptor subunit TctC
MMLYRWLVACVITFASLNGAFAQGWPTRSIRIIVPVTAGSATDVTARIIAEHLAAQLSQPVVVENRTGAGGTTGMGYVAKSVEPDGYPSWCIPRLSRSSPRRSPISATIPARISPA